jgi:hypothetical protein
MIRVIPTCSTVGVHMCNPNLPFIFVLIQLLASMPAPLRVILYKSQSSDVIFILYLNWRLSVTHSSRLIDFSIINFGPESKERKRNPQFLFLCVFGAKSISTFLSLWHLRQASATSVIGSKESAGEITGPEHPNVAEFFREFLGIFRDF